MSTRPLDRIHPVSEFARALITRLDRVAAIPVWSMTAAEQREALRALARADSRLAALRLRVLAGADRSGATDTEAACSAADWLAVETQQVHRSTRADLHLARDLETHPVLAEAMSTGEVNLAQERAIIHALDRLPTTGADAVPLEQRQHAERHLVGLATDYDAHALRVLGRRVFEVIAPETAEAFEGKVLSDQEAAALRRTTFTMREDDEGTCHGRFRIPLLHGHLLHKFLLPIASPARHPHAGPGTGAAGDSGGEPTGDAAPVTGIAADLPAQVRHGLAFCQLLEAVPATSLPQAGGTTATVVVSMTLAQLTTALEAQGVCDLDTGGQISAGQARRLACAAGLVPAAQGGRSEVLDLGRRRRLHTSAQRLAMTLRDHGCTAAGCDRLRPAATGCDRPPSMCHAHHDTPWSAGGHTDVATGRLLCGHHHRRIHDPAYQHHVQPNGEVTFHRRP